MLLELEKVKMELLQNKKKLGWNKTLFHCHCLSVKMSQRWRGGGGNPQDPPCYALALIDDSKKSSKQYSVTNKLYHVYFRAEQIKPAVIQRHNDPKERSG